MGYFRNLIVIICLVSAAQVSFAQSPGVVGPRRQIATIIFAGLGGAVLGLSTLSFYGEPQEHASNIATGFGLGIIGGVAYVSYKTTAEYQITPLGGKDLYVEYRSGFEKRKGLSMPPPLWKFEAEF